MNGQTRSVFTSIIIPHYNDLDNLRECLRLLRAQTAPADQFEVIVCDNNSACGLGPVEETCQGFARVVLARRQGAADARNAGVAAACGEALAFIDSDCRPERDWLERGLKALDNADIVGGRIVVGVEDRKRLTSAEAYELVFAFNNRRYVEEQGYTATANMFARKDAFERVGPFRARVSEDLDWGQRASKLGLRMRYADDAIIMHPARREWVDLIKKWRRMTSESYTLACEKPYGKVWWFARSWLVLLSPVLQGASVVTSANLDSFTDRTKALCGLVRLRVWRFVECQRKLLA